MKGSGTDPTMRIVAGKLYYVTPYNRQPNGPVFHEVSFRYKRTFQVFDSKVLVQGVQGGNTVESNPRREDLFFMDGTLSFFNVQVPSGSLQTFTAPSTAKRLTVLNDDWLAAAGNAPLVTFPILEDGSLGTGNQVAITGSSRNLTQLISAPDCVYFTQATGTSPGGFGSILFSEGYSEATTALMFKNMASSRGGVYDPYTHTIILMGLNEITQIPPNLVAGGPVTEAVPYISRLDLEGFGGVQDVFLRQGCVDGKGHLYAASSSGHLFFIDYSRSRQVGASGNYNAVAPLESIRDVAVKLGRSFGAEDTPAEEGPRKS